MAMAAALGHEHIVEAMLDNMTDSAAEYEPLVKSMHLAAAGGHTEIITLLLNAKLKIIQNTYSKEAHISLDSVDEKKEIRLF